MSAEGFRCKLSPWWVCKCTQVFAKRPVCVADLQNKGPQCLIFRSVLNEPQAGWAAGERGSLENQQLSSSAIARAGTWEIH